MTSTDYWPFALFLLFPFALIGCQDRTTEQTPLLAPQQADWTDDRPTPEAILEHFKVAADGAFLLLPVVLKGKEFLFALDTGASSGVVDSSLTPLLGEPIGTQDVRTSDGVTRMPLFQSPDAKLGGLCLRTGSPVVAADLSRVREGTGEEVYGFIGMDFLGKHIFRIDRSRGEVIFLRSPGPDPGPRLPMTFQENIPFVWVQVSGMDEPQRFQVDTGASSGGGTGLMQTDTFDRLTKQGKIQPTENSLAQTISGMSLRRRGKVTEISVAGHRHADLIFSTAPRNVLGLNYWSRYVATFDFPGGAIHLKRGSKYHQPDTQDLSGLTFVRVNGRTLVLSVEKGSPAALADIKPQDVILKANGEQTETTSLVALRRRLGVEGTKVSLVVTRGGEDREVLLVLQAVDK